jgi:hypothetical protein
MSKRSLQLNPLLKAATWEDIKAKRNELEQSPISTPYGVFDADRDSVIRIGEALSSFHGLPTLVDGTLGWKRADNIVVMLSFVELLAVRQAITNRAAILFAQAEVLKAGGPYQVKDLDNLALWGLPD